MRSFTAYSSVGNGNYSWLENLQYRSTKSDVLGEDGRYARVVKYVRLTQVPQRATLRMWSFGLTLGQLYVNGTAVAPAATVDITPYLIQGRNQIAVFFERTSAATRTINYANRLTNVAATFAQLIYSGKFDAELDVDGELLIVRGDDTRFDPRAVWHGVTASTWIEAQNYNWTPDALARELPHLDYGLPRDPDLDGLGNQDEQALMSNPRSADSDNDGVTDGNEDFDADGLTNAQEFVRLSDPLRVDTDDDGIEDGAEVIAGTSPVDSLSPLLPRVLDLTAAGSAVAMPMDRRFALASWTIEAYVRPLASAAADIDGVILRRSVGVAVGTGVHYVTWELSLTNGIPAVRVTGASLSGEKVVSKLNGDAVLGNTWTHLAATYDEASTSLRLYRNGVLVAAQTIGTTCAITGPGPIITSIGAADANGFRGLVEDVRIYGVALSGTTLEARRYAVLTGNEADLVAYYRFDDGTYSTSLADRKRFELTEGQVEDFAMPVHDWRNEWENAATLKHGAAMREMLPTETDPFDADRWTDSDADGMADWWELQYFGDLSHDGTGDADGDLLKDLSEYHAGTNPTVFDTDVIDSASSDGEADPDRDGLWNYEEQEYGTHPQATDTDDDGLNDYDELFVRGTDPANSLQPVVPRVLRLTGSEYMVVSDSAATSQSRFTLAVWVKPAASAVAQGILRRTVRDGGNANYRLVLTATNTIEFSYDTPVTGRTVRVTSGTPIADDKWTLVVARLNTDTTTGVARVFDLNLFVPSGDTYTRFSTTGLAIGSPVIDTMGELVVGFAEDTSADLMKRVNCTRFMGDLDEIVLWNRLLTTAEMQALSLTAPAPASATVPADMVAYFKFDDGGVTAEDFAQVADWFQNWRHAGGFSPDNRIVVDGIVSGVGEPDRLPDAWEVRYFGSLNVSQGLDNQDFDGDGLSDWYEYLAGTDPTKPDSNGDGILDVNEDMDGDGLTNGYEQNVSRTHPGQVDTDDDGVPDNAEANTSTDAANALNPFHARCAVFGSEGGRLVVANQTRHELTTWTVEARLRLPTTSGSGILVRRALQSATPQDSVNFELGVDAGKPYVRFTDVAGVSQQVMATTAISADTWHHLAGTLSATGALTLYIDGSYWGVNLTAGVCRTRGLTGAEEISMGAGYQIAGSFAHALPAGAKLDEIRLWNTVRTPTQISENRDNTLNVASLTVDDMNPLVGYWRFDDGLGIGSHSIEDFTASLVNIDHLPDWAFGWPHAAYPAGAITIGDESESLDSDHDGLPDWWEIAVFGDLTQTATGDWDGDQLTNLAEFLGIDGVGQTQGAAGSANWGIGDGTDPKNSDTDGDGLPDGTEVNVYHTKPYAADSDDDSYADLTEIMNGTLPNYALDPYKSLSVSFDGAPASMLRAAARADLSQRRFTVELWFKRATVTQSGEQILLSRKVGEMVSYELGIDAQYRPFGRFSYTTSGNHLLKAATSSAMVQDASTWHHIALVYDPVDRGDMRLYVDGILRDVQFTWLIPDLALADLMIGSNGTSGFAGKIDEVRIWKVARSASDISSSMRRQLSGAEPDMVSLFMMDDGEWAGSTKSPDRFGAQDFVTNRLGDSACGRGGYAFSTDVPDLLPSDSDNDGLPDVWEIANGLSPNDATGVNGAAGDPDNDGLSNLGEYNAGTRAQHADTDVDGMADGWEVANGLNPLRDDAAEDPDGDGLANISEYLGADLVVNLVAIPPTWGDATNPMDSDSDGDGLPDGWERSYGLDANSAVGINGATGDPDNDGLTNAQERDYLTDPRNRDSDGDGLPDGWEVTHAFNPLNPIGVNGATGDPDSDGATNIVEFGQGTDPRDRDTDNDSLPDGWEIRYGLNPLSATTPNGRNDDPDMDSRTNYEEYLAGTDPKVAEDETIDSDSDGLTDIQEWQPGVNTDPHLVDTDDDGVNDYREFVAGSEGYNSLSKADINTFVDLARYNRLDYRGNLMARFTGNGALEVPGVADTEQRLAFASWTVEARFRFRFGPGTDATRGELVKSELTVGEELYLVRRAFGAAAGSDTNYAIGLKFGARTINGVEQQYLYPFAKWYNSADATPERIVQVTNLELVENQWYHLTGRYDAAARVLTLFLDGDPVAEQREVSGYCPAVVEGKTPFVRLGENYAGDVDEVRIWGVKSRQLRYRDALSGQNHDLAGVVLSNDQIALNAARSVVPGYGIYDGGIADTLTLVNVDPALYAVDRHVTQTAWSTLSGTSGRLATGIYYQDANASGAWDEGETVWADRTGSGTSVAGAYDLGTDVLIHYTTPAPTAPISGATVRPLTMYYNDANGDQAWQTGEDAWVDYANTASWYEAQSSPWAQAMALALYVKFDDAGQSIEDYAWHADWRAFWAHALRPEGSMTMANVVIDGNDAPTAPQMRIAPVTATKQVASNALLRAEIILPSTDPDGLRVQYRYSWFRGTRAPSASAGISFSDTNADGRWDEGEVIFSDANKNGIMDGDDYQLIVAAAPALGHALTLDLAALSGVVTGQFYYAVVVPVDDLGKDGPFAFDYVVTGATVSPIRPTFVSLTPTQAQEGNALVLTLNNSNTRAVSILVDWYRNSELFTSSSLDNVTAAANGLITLDGSLTRRGDLWSFMAYASDADGGQSRPTYGSGAITATTQVRVTRVIGGGVGSAAENRPPTAPTLVHVTPDTPLDADLLICDPSGSVDPEGDAFAYYYQWYRLRTPETAYAPIVGQTTPVLSETLTLPGDRWFCQVYAMDIYANRSVTISSNPVIIGNTVVGTLAYEPNNTYNQARRILPKSNPLSLVDLAVQRHTFGTSEDRDWFWFLVEDGPGYERLRVTFETSNITTMWSPYYSGLADVCDTVLALYRSNGSGAPSFVRQVDDVGVTGVTGQLGESNFARVEVDLTPGVYYVQVWTNSTITTTNGAYLAHLWFEVPSGASGPSAPTTVTLLPQQPNTADDLICTASGGVSPLGESHISYKYVWFRNGQIVPFGSGAQPYEGANYVLANAKPAVSADGSPANVVPSTYTRAGEVWTCQVFATDSNGESTGSLSNSVTIGTVSWTQAIQVAKTFTDGTAAVTQTVTLGWRFGATHGFDLNIDADLPTPGDLPPGGPGGAGTGVVMTPAGSSYSVGLEADHTRLTTDMRPYGDMTSWYLKVDLGLNPATCRLTWNGLSLPVTETPLTITRVQEGPYGEFYPVYGTTLDMSTVNGITLTSQDIEDIIAAAGGSTQGYSALFRVSLGTGDANQTLTLDYGWNMISFAIQPITPAVRSVFAFNGQQVIAGTAWAYQNGGYVAVTEVEAKVGYWVFCPLTSGATFTVHGLPVGGQLALVTGWNLVGPVVDTNVVEAYSAYSQAPDGNGAVDLNYDAVLRENLGVKGINPSTKGYETTPIMKKGQAYWIKASRNVELSAP
jgi:hypothetical protein